MMKIVCAAFAIFACNALITFPSIVYHGMLSTYRYWTVPNNTTLPDGVHDVILFIHGIDGCSADFLDMRDYLSAKGVNAEMISIDFGRNSGLSVYQEVQIIWDILKPQWNRIRKIWIVGHSKGGIDAILYAKHAELNRADRFHSASVAGIITISSPIKGSLIASHNPIYPMARRELGLGSQVINNLVPGPPSFKLLHIVPAFDHLIQPTSNAKSDFGEAYVYRGYSWFGFYAHNGVMYDPEVAELVRKFVSA